MSKWKDKETHHEEWRGRRIAIAEKIPNCDTILEVGAGKHSMRDLVKCGKYFTSDVKTSEGVDLALDLNGELPQNLKFDLVVWSGVLEYVNLPNAFFSWLRIVSRGFVGSYYATENLGMSASEAAVRSRNGWRNHLTLNELSKIAMENGFLMVYHEPWENQAIFSGISCHE